MSSTSLDNRRRPNPGYRVAPPVADAFTPWVSALDEGLGSGEYEWVLGADGALVPTPVAADGARIRPKRRWWSRSSQ